MTIEQRGRDKLAAGAPLSTGEAAAVLGVSKPTVQRMIAAGVLSARIRPGVGGYRDISAESVRAELERTGRA
jgi:excisionase family DNA binding protein